jgi:alpha-glucosidase
VPFEKMRDPYGIAFWPKFKGRDGCRTPLAWNDAPLGGFSTAEPWLPISPAHRALSVAAQERDPHSTLQAFRRLVAWRNGLEVLRAGEIDGVCAIEEVLVFHRRLNDAHVIAAFNLGDVPATIELPDLGGARPLDGHGLPEGQLTGTRLSLPAHAVYFGSPRTSA